MFNLFKSKEAIAAEAESESKARKRVLSAMVQSAEAETAARLRIMELQRELRLAEQKAVPMLYASPKSQDRFNRRYAYLEDLVVKFVCEENNVSAPSDIVTGRYQLCWYPDKWDQIEMSTFEREHLRRRLHDLVKARGFVGIPTCEEFCDHLEELVEILSGTNQSCYPGMIEKSSASHLYSAKPSL